MFKVLHWLSVMSCSTCWVVPDMSNIAVALVISMTGNVEHNSANKVAEVQKPVQYNNTNCLCSICCCHYVFSYAHTQLMTSVTAVNLLSISLVLTTVCMRNSVAGVVVGGEGFCYVCLRKRRGWCTATEELANSSCLTHIHTHL